MKKQDAIRTIRYYMEEHLPRPIGKHYIPKDRFERIVYGRYAVMQLAYLIDYNNSEETPIEIAERFLDRMERYWSQANSTTRIIFEYSAVAVEDVLHILYEMEGCYWD